MFARRAGWDLAPAPLAERVAARRAHGLPVLDLTDANPTHAGLAAPAEALALALGELARDGQALRYDPDARGDPRARAAAAGCHRGVAADQIVLCAGTSEGYAHLFRLLGDPGDRIHLPSPGYPLFEHLAGLEGLQVESYPLRPPDPGEGPRWRIEVDALEASLDARSRAVVLIHPHNPTGSWVDPADLERLRELGRARGFALISDEVFAESGPGDGAPPGAAVGAGDGPLTFVLSGASKLLALPQLKLAWIVAAGPPRARDEALARLEFVADAFLSVSPLAARLLPRLLAQRAAIRRELRERVAANRARLAGLVAGAPPLCCLPAEAGWTAILRIPEPIDEEALAIRLLDRTGVLAHPGFVFDLAAPRGAPAAHLVLSLLPEPESFSAAAQALLDEVARGA